MKNPYSVLFYLKHESCLNGYLFEQTELTRSYAVLVNASFEVLFLSLLIICSVDCDVFFLQFS